MFSQGRIDMLLHKPVYFMLTALLMLTLACGGGDETASTEGQAVETESYFEVDSETAATVTGTVILEGNAPRNPRINMSAEPDCHGLHTGAVRAEVVLVGEGGTLGNTFVWVKSGLEGKKFRTPSDSVALDQKGCIYSPHVVGLQTRQKLAVSNSDPTTHNVHPLPKINREWNKSQTADAPAIERSFSRQEIMMPVKCNIHPWMRSYINVVEHPFFAVTGADGSFELKGLPPGTYTIEAVHERFKSQEISVTIGASESKKIDFSYKAG